MMDHEQDKAIVGRIDAELVSLDRSLAGLARANDVTIASGGAGVILAAHSAAISRGGAVGIVSGGSMTVTQGGGQALVAGGSMTVIQGGGGVMVAGQASVEKSLVGVLICGRATLHDGVRVLLNTPQAIAMGVALGLALALASRWLRRGQA